MKKIVQVKTIGEYTISLDEDSVLTVQASTMRDPLTLNAGQVQELLHWLSEQREVWNIRPHTDQSPVIASEKPEEIAWRAIDEAIETARRRYPASLEPENRDRFIEQIARTPSIKPLMTRGDVSRKQITLWVEQRLSSRK